MFKQYDFLTQTGSDWLRTTKFTGRQLIQVNYRFDDVSNKKRFADNHKILSILLEDSSGVNDHL